MLQLLGHGGFTKVVLVQLPVGGWAARKSCPQTHVNLGRLSLVLDLLIGARRDRVANVLWALLTQLDTQGDLSFDMEPTEHLTLG